MRRSAIVAIVFALLALGMIPATAQVRPPEKVPEMTGSGGAVASVDAAATEAGIRVLRNGGNAIDAAVATAAVLGVTEPYSAGVGGGGFMVIYLAETGEVVTLDGREEAPSDPRFDSDVFIEDGSTIPFGERVTSGLGVGVPGTFATWVAALEDYGTISLREALEPGRTVATRGFEVDQTFADQTAGNLARFRLFPATANTFLVNGDVPAVGSIFRNPDLAKTYRYLASHGLDGFYDGPLAEIISSTIQNPQTIPNPPVEVRPGYVTTEDIAAYQVLAPDPTVSEYRGYEVFGMGPPSSGGITVGEALNIMDGFDLATADGVDFWHFQVEATALAFADRNAYIGDNRPGFEYVPIVGLLSEEFGDERAALIDPAAALAKPVAPGNPCPADGNPQCVPDPASLSEAAGAETTHLTTADQWGNVVSYTLTIESTGGSGMTVPGYGFLLNNELTDFNATGPSPNLPAPSKRPRSSMSPTIVLADGAPVLAAGSPGGSTIITTAVSVVTNVIDRGMGLADAIAAPRATQRNTSSVLGEAAWIAEYGAGLEALGHSVSGTGEIGAATGVALYPDGTMTAGAETERRGGGSAAVVIPGG